LRMTTEAYSVDALLRVNASNSAKLLIFASSKCFALEMSSSSAARSS
jgi:hypothetical protein